MAKAIHVALSLSFAALLGSLLLVVASVAAAFMVPDTHRQGRSHSAGAALYLSSRSRARSKNIESNHLLEEYRTANGEILNPYNVLKVRRDADMSEIKNSYRRLSRRYHPDGHRHRDILPGSCNNLEEVRDEWEKIRSAYEILRNPQKRRRFDRHEVLADPGEAMRRAAVGAAVEGAKNVGKGIFDGIFSVGSMAVRHLSQNQNEDGKRNTSRTSSELPLDSNADELRNAS